MPGIRGVPTQLVRLRARCFTRRAKRRTLARLLTAGLLCGVGLAPLPPEALPTLFAHPEEIAAAPVAAEWRALPLQAPSSLSEEVPAAPPLPESRVEIAAIAVPKAAPEPPVLLIVSAITPRPPVLVPAPPPAVQAASGAQLPVGATTLAEATPAIINKGAAAAAIAASDPPVLAVAEVPAPVPAITPPVIEERVALASDTPRRVDIAQIHEGASAGIYVPQLREPGLVPGGPNLAEKTAAMQVALPPPARLTERELALLQTDTPAELTVRVGGESVGKVAFRMSENRTIDVQLSGLLDVLADRFAPEEFSRLRSAAAAQGYVPLDSLRLIGLSMRYDPVYDELRISA